MSAAGTTTTKTVSSASPIALRSNTPANPSRTPIVRPPRMPPRTWRASAVFFLPTCTRGPICPTMDSPQGVAAVDSPTTRLRLTSTKTDGTPTDGSASAASIAATSPIAPASATTPPTRAVLAMRVLFGDGGAVSVPFRVDPAAAGLERSLLVEQRLELAPVVRDAADHDAPVVVEQVRERGERHHVVLLDLAVRVDHHRRLEAVHAPERPARLRVAAADDEEVELAAPRLPHLVQARHQLAARETAGRREDEQPRNGRQFVQGDGLAALRVRGDELGSLRSTLEPAVRDQRARVVTEAQLEQSELAERAREEEREDEDDEPQDEVGSEPDAAHSCSFG